ncbi:MAG: ferredoxin [Candidatus Margulisbacteria bacterium]|nr:ferredoxin [Candidatus Margulisiibacteriota bacterium]
MTITLEENLRISEIKQVAAQMLTAARTAPKGKGIDHTVLAMVEGDDIKKISKKLKELGEKYDHSGFLRDAENILCAPVMLLLGSKIKSIGLKKCGLCGYKDCAEKDQYPNIPCAFNPGDLGIAIGSAVSIAMDHRVDNRIMYTVGQAVMELGLLGEDVKIVYAIPLSATSKNPFFDRK